MDVRTMEYITAIAEEGNLSGAGKKLGVSQPTLSVFLSRLETELGTDLFYREKKKLVMTPAGRWASCSSCPCSSELTMTVIPGENSAFSESLMRSGRIASLPSASRGSENSTSLVPAGRIRASARLISVPEPLFIRYT